MYQVSNVRSEIVEWTGSHLVINDADLASIIQPYRLFCYG